MSTQLQKTKTHPTVVWLKSATGSAEVRKRLAEVMPRGVSLDRIMRTALAAVAADAYLQACDPASILRAVMRLAQVGLEPNTPLQQAFLVPYGKRCEPVLGYRGMIELARRSGQIVSIAARAVLEGDRFEYAFGLEEKLIHVPAPDMEQDRKLTHAYALAALEGGGKQWDVMTKAEIDRIRSRALANKRNVAASPWSTDYVEMAKKTVLRRMWKLLPISIHAAAMAQREEAMDRGEDAAGDDADLADVIDVAAEVEPEQRAEAEEAHRRAQGLPPEDQQVIDRWTAAIRETSEPRQLFEVEAKIGSTPLPTHILDRLAAIAKDQRAKLGGAR